MLPLQKAMDQPTPVIRRMLAVLVTVISIAALKLATEVVMPLALALFVLLIAWPLQEKLRGIMPRGAAYTLTLLVLLVVATGFVYGIVFGMETLGTRLPGYISHLDAALHHWMDWLGQHGLHVARFSDLVRQSLGQISGATSALVGEVYSVSETALLTIAYVVLGLWEAPQFSRRMRQAASTREIRELAEVLDAMMRRYQRYLLVRTLTSLIIGIGTIASCWGVGLDFVLVWGLVGFLLNYIPVIGAVIAVVPPTVLAIVQFGDIFKVIWVLGSLSLLHIFVGNYVDSILQGRQLAMSPLVVLLSVMFWGWVWGVPGAFLGIPLMVAVVIITGHFPSTRWIALLIADTSFDT